MPLMLLLPRAEPFMNVKMRRRWRRYPRGIDFDQGNFLNICSRPSDPGLLVDCLHHARVTCGVPPVMLGLRSRTLGASPVMLHSACCARHGPPAMLLS